VFGRTEERDKNIGMVAPDNSEMWRVDRIEVESDTHSFGIRGPVFNVRLTSSSGCEENFNGDEELVNENLKRRIGKTVWDILNG
jgi:hypothetical protein